MRSHANLKVNRIRCPAAGGRWTEPPLVGSRHDAYIVAREELMRSFVGLWILSFALVANASGSGSGAGEVGASATAAPGYEIVELVRGSWLRGANGTYVGPDGHLYVASVLSGEIVAFDVDSGDVVHRFGPADGVLNPDDLTFGPDGSLYWTDLFAGEVGRRAPDGTVTKQVVGPGVNPITFSADGRLFVSRCFFGDGLYELDPELTLPPRTIVEADEQNPLPLGWLNAFDFGPDGRLVGPLQAKGMFISIDVDSCEGTSDPWSDCDVRLLASGFPMPTAAKFDAHGVLHVVDLWAGEVSTLDLATGEPTVVAEPGQGLDNLAFDATGRLFVTNADEGSVFEVLPGGAVRLVKPGGLVAPAGVIALDRPGGGTSVFVGDTLRMWEFDAESGVLVGFTRGASDYSGATMWQPSTLWTDGEAIVLTNMMIGLVQMVDARSLVPIEGHFFGFPYDAVRLGTDLAVIDLTAGGVVWASTRDVILAIDEQQVFLPVGLATDGERLWVSDWAAGTVWQVAFEGAAALPAVPVASALANPEGLAPDGLGGLLVVETGTQQLSRIDLATGVVEPIASGLDVGLAALPGMPPPFLRSGVTVDAAGAIYVIGDVTNVVYRITRR
jgi:sugar lactone lactonase YvrE